jgi:hypothetical protein
MLIKSFSPLSLSAKNRAMRSSKKLGSGSIGPVISSSKLRKLERVIAV